MTAIDAPGGRGPGLAIVCDSGQYDRLRHCIHSVRERQKLGPDQLEIYVLDIGLTPGQLVTLRLADVRVIQVKPACEAGAVPMPAKFMYKLFADRFVPKADPLIVCDNDIEFQDPGVLAELIDIARSRLFICEEVYGWLSNVNVQYHVQQQDAVASLLLGTDDHLLKRHPILNAGLWGGPRGGGDRLGALDQFLALARLVTAGGLRVYSWYWEQIAFCQILRLGVFDLQILSTEHNWITHWGDNPKARIRHFCGEGLGYLGKKLRISMPAGYLKVPEPVNRVRERLVHKDFTLDVVTAKPKRRGAK